MPTGIDDLMLRAYRETEYHVAGESPFILRIGEISAELAQVHGQHGVDCSAFVTACNPFSQPLDQAANATRQRQLEAELRRRSLHFLPGIGQHPGNGWPGEESFLILGITREAASTLGRRFEQNAILWSGADALPQLVLLAYSHSA